MRVVSIHPEDRCPDCGLPGHGPGDMCCPEPQDHEEADINDTRPLEDIDFVMREE